MIAHKTFCLSPVSRSSDLRVLTHVAYRDVPARGSEQRFWRLGHSTLFHRQFFCGERLGVTYAFPREESADRCLSRELSKVRVRVTGFGGCRPTLARVPSAPASSRTRLALLRRAALRAVAFGHPGPGHRLMAW